MPVDPSYLDDLEFFKHFDDEDRQILASELDSTALTSGVTLFEVGTPGDALYIVRSGAIELSIRDMTGQKIVLHTVRPGEFFGELSLLDGGPRTATAVAVEETELIELDRDDLTLLFRKRPDAAFDVLAGMGSMTRRADELLKSRVSRNVNEAMEEQSTTVERVADWIAWFSGSIPFFVINVVWFAVWIGLNTLPLPFEPFDPYPFGFLTMVVSLEAIFLSIFVLISQNRQAAKDHIRSDVEYEVNIKAELEVTELHQKVDRLSETMFATLARLEKEAPSRPPAP